MRIQKPNNEEMLPILHPNAELHVHDDLRRVFPSNSERTLPSRSCGGSSEVSDQPVPELIDIDHLSCPYLHRKFTQAGHLVKMPSVRDVPIPKYKR